MRHEIENTLHIKAYDIYGLSEIMGPGVACECECQNGMHVWEDNFIVEIIDPIPASSSPTAALASLCSPRSPRRASPLSVTGRGISARSIMRNASAVAPMSA